MNKKPVNHGKLSGYNYYKCRCFACREAYSEYQKKTRQARIAKAQMGIIPERAHGTVGGHTNYLCTCEKCNAAWAEYKRNQRAQKNTIRTQLEEQ